MIPNYLLIHKCVRVRETVVDAWGKTSEETMDIDFARFEPAAVRSWTGSGDFSDVKAAMYTNFEDIKEGDKIRFDGKEYIVKRVLKTYGFEFDHLECELV